MPPSAPDITDTLLFLQVTRNSSRKCSCMKIGVSRQAACRRQEDDGEDGLADTLDCDLHLFDTSSSKQQSVFFHLIKLSADAMSRYESL
jgi:hypothetical protein